MKSSVWRVAGIMGVAGAAVLAMGSLAMASGGPQNQPPIQTIQNASNQGTISITEKTSNSGTATWTWNGLIIGDYVSVYSFPKGSPQTPTPLPASDGKVITAGVYTVNVNLPPGDSWSNTGIEMATTNFAVGQLPEVPWAAGLPLLLVLPWGISMWRRRQSRV